MPDWHKNNQSVLTPILVAVCIAAIVVFGVIGARRYLRDERQEESIRREAERYNVAMLEARNKKAELESELAVLDEEDKIQIRNRGTILFLCAEPDVRVWSEVRPIIEDAGFTGVIALTEDSFPGMAGCMSVRELAEMQSNGWDIVITAQKNSDTAGLFRRAREAGFTPKGLYFPTPQLPAEAEELAKDLGVSALFTYSSDEGAKQPEIYRILTLGCNENGIKNVTEESIASSKTMALSIGFRNTREIFDQTSVTNMVAFVKKKTEAGSVRVASVEEALARTAEVDRITGEARKKTEGKRQEIQAQLDELDAILFNGEVPATVLAEESSEKGTETGTSGSGESETQICSETETAAASFEGQSASETETEPVTEEQPEETAAGPTSETAKETVPAKPASAETKSTTAASAETKATTAASAKTKADAVASETEATAAAAETSVPETAAAKKRRTGKTPDAPPPPEIEETPGAVYVETVPEETSPAEAKTDAGEIDTGWPDATMEIVPEGPGFKE